jgi:hypothetical protein
MFFLVVSSELGALHRRFFIYMLLSSVHRAVVIEFKVKINLKTVRTEL